MSVTDDGFLLDWVQRARARGGDQAPSGWPLNPPSSAEMLEATEARLGVRLPPLYRSLLSLSNGIMDVPNDVSVPSLLPCDRIAWMRDVDPILLDTVDTESAEHDHEPIRPEPWDLGDDRPCTACLPDTLVIGQHPTGGYILLDPHQVAPSGEWACWDYDGACVITGRFPDLRTYFHFSCNDFLPPPAGHDPVAAARRVMQDPAEDLWGRQQAAYALEALGRADLVLPWLLDQLAGGPGQAPHEVRFAGQVGRPVVVIGGRQGCLQFLVGLTPLRITAQQITHGAHLFCCPVAGQHQVNMSRSLLVLHQAPEPPARIIRKRPGTFLIARGSQPLLCSGEVLSGRDDEDVDAVLRRQTGHSRGPDMLHRHARGEVILQRRCGLLEARRPRRVIVAEAEIVDHSLSLEVQ